MSTVRGLAVAATDTKRLALIGNPNCGKTTIFNHLTGLRHKVANYAGVTVERREGAMSGRPDVRVLDLPGCYSLTPRSIDQRIARDALLGWAKDVQRPDALIVVLDASNLERNLFLATQILELNLPTIIVCNMLDVVRSRKHRIDLDALQSHLGAPVIGTVGATGEGIDRLRAAIDSLEPHEPRTFTWQGEDAANQRVAHLRGLIRTHGIVDPGMANIVASLLLAPAVLDESQPGFANLPPAFSSALAELHRADGHDVSAISQAVETRYRWLGQCVEAVFTHAETTTTTHSDRIDRVVTHKVWGLVCFGAVMLTMLVAIFSWATPLMDGIDWAVGSLGAAAASTLGEGILADLIVDGVVAGVGNVVVFFPQICILFLFIALLEDSGYMARVAFVMDGLMSKVGLHGKSFIPLLSSFACAVPAIMATRTIENRRDRFTTMLVAPLMSCSARLPIYIILISALFGTSVWEKTGIMMSMYALGTLAALVVALILKRTILKGPTPTFVLELPPYRRPRLGAALRNTWDRGKMFLTEAGSVILAMSIILWALAYFPRAPESANVSAGEQLRRSYIGRIGRSIEPVLEPLGFDWKIGVGLVSSFAAREVFVATMGVVYGIEEEADEESATLRQEIATATWPDGRKVFTPLVGISLMVFYVLACQCMSTLAVVKRETDSWRWPAFMFAYMTALAYSASFLVYQCGTALGLG